MREVWKRAKMGTGYLAQRPGLKKKYVMGQTMTAMVRLMSNWIAFVPFKMLATYNPAANLRFCVDKDLRRASVQIRPALSLG